MGDAFAWRAFAAETSGASNTLYDENMSKRRLAWGSLTHCLVVSG